jgi:hypothetical protein
LVADSDPVELAAPFVVSLSNHIPNFQLAYFSELFLASRETAAQSPRINASFLTRRQPLICRSKLKALDSRGAFLAEYQLNRQAGGGVATRGAGRMFVDAFVEVVGMARVVRPICTT